MTKIRSVALGAIMAMAAASPASAQVTASEADVRLERAQLLTEHAYQLARLGGDYITAGTLLRDAAELRGRDSATVQALIDAGRFNYYGGRPLVAVSAFKAAGETALALGDGPTAARAFHDAAWVAKGAGELTTARELMVRSESIEITTVVALGLDR